MKGTIKALKTGYGFINADNKGEFFFHRSDFIGHWEDLISDFHEGNSIKVEFGSEDTPKGPRARNVKRLDFPNEAA